jgi:hypothetical protein
MPHEAVSVDVKRLTRASNSPVTTPTPLAASSDSFLKSGIVDVLG